MTRFLITSLVLTIALNLVLRLSPGVQRWLDRRFRSLAEPGDGPEVPGRRVRVYVPWKGMLIASLTLTVLLNAVNVLAR